MVTRSEQEAQELDRIRVGISSCLLGKKVRFDGGHKHDSYINGTLSAFFEFVPFCPEVAIGLGVPRGPIRLVRLGEEVHALGARDPNKDVTVQLEAYGRQIGSTVTDICGYILKRGSPSCGMERVKIYGEKGMPITTGAGLYARTFMETQPLLPVEEEGRLGDPVLRENFIERVFVYHRWQKLVSSGLTPAKLVDFHTGHKLVVMAHSQAAYRRMGRLVAGAGSRPITGLVSEYFGELMIALKRRVSRKQHVNVLQHILGYLREALDQGDRAELVDTIEQYRRGLVPLIVPITLFRHHFRRQPQPYIERQLYLRPHPGELMLRNLL
jgi:uncharacterized protein YbgA (DUF1722 family)/uncharacterized protein YbbK (DUF523 family)